ncbi:hypothetical protein ACJX0J_034880, partial [Zea mays]
LFALYLILFLLEHNIKLWTPLVGLLHVIVAEYRESKTEVKSEKGSLSVVYEFCISEFDATEGVKYIQQYDILDYLKHDPDFLCHKNKHYMKQLTTGTIKQANKGMHR